MSYIQKIKNFIKKYFLFICLFIISIIKIHITNKLPILALPEQVYDDGLMVLLAKNLIEGNWLGTYGSNTLVKGIGFPMFLAILKSFNIQYLFAMNILYTLSCLYFLYSIKDDIKNNIIRIVIYIMMLFNPVSFAEYTFQRVYRNGIIIFQTVFIFSAVYIVWKKKFQSFKTLLPHMLLASINMIFLWHSREDAIWIIPFLIVSLFLIVICIIVHSFTSKKTEKPIVPITKWKFYSNLIAKSLLVLMPLWILFFSTTAIKIMNYRHYGIYIERESETYLNKVVAALYSVKAYEEYPRVDNTREKINRVYEVSETLSSIKPYLEDSLDLWAQYSSKPELKEVENGWFGWSLKHAVLTAGKYFDPNEVNEFYRKIYNEITEALETGKLEREPNVISSMLPPLRESYKGHLLEYCTGYIIYISEFRDMYASNLESPEFNGLASTKVSDFEFVTNNQTASRDVTNARICGWYALKNGEDFKLYLSNEKREKIVEIPRGESSDVINVFSLNPDLQYRFDYVITDIENTRKYEKLFISVYDLNDNFIEDVPLENYQQNAVLESDNSMYCLSIIAIEKNVDPVKTFSESSVKILSYVQKAYSKIGKWLIIASLSTYFIIIIITIIKSIKNKKLSKEFDVALILSAFLLSAIVDLAGVAYTGLTSCYTLLYFYLVAIFPLLMMFATLGIGYLVETIVNKVKVKLIS